MLQQSQNSLCLKASIWLLKYARLTHHPYNDLDLPIKDIKFEKKSTTKFTFMVDSTRFLFDIATQKLVIKDTMWKEKKKPIWPTYSPTAHGLPMLKIIIFI